MGLYDSPRDHNFFFNIPSLRKRYDIIERLSRKTAEIGTILFVLLVVSAYISFLFGNAGISMEQISLMTSDGVQLNAKVYKPTSSSGRLPAIVVCHGLMASLTMMQSGYSLEFAKRGFIVIAIDMRGHGQSGGIIDSGIFYGIMENLSSQFSLMPHMFFDFLTNRTHHAYGVYNTSLAEKALGIDVETAVNYLASRPDVDPNRIALLGHSMGGLAVIVEAISDPRIEATVGIAPAISPTSNINSTYPRNLMLAVGARDNIVGEARVLELYEKATGETGKVGEVCGNFLDGSAREMVISPNSDHVGEMFDTYIIEEAIAWVEKSLAVENSAPISVSFWPNAILPLSVISSLLLIFPVLLIADNLIQLMGKKKPFQKPKLTSMRARKLLLMYIIAWSCSIFSDLTYSLLLWIPLYMSSMIIGAYMIAPTITFLVALIYRKRLNWDSAKPNTAALKSLVIGVLAFLAFFIGLNLAVSWDFANLTPTYTRLLWVTIIFAMLLPFNFFDELWIRNLQNRLTVNSYLRIGIAALISLSFKLLALASLSFLFGAFILLMAALFLIPSSFSAWLFEKTGNIFGGVMFNSMFIAWIVATILPFSTHLAHL
jgi:dienelactone hydrolase